MTQATTGAIAPIATLSPIVYQGQRVITLAQMDLVHQRASGTARRTFNAHKDKLIEGEDYFAISADEIRTHKIMPVSGMAREAITALTESGYLLLVKSFHDDLAWRVQRELVNGYFRVTQPKQSQSTLNIHDAAALQSAYQAAQEWADGVRAGKQPRMGQIPEQVLQGVLYQAMMDTRFVMGFEWWSGKLTCTPVARGVTLLDPDQGESLKYLLSERLPMKRVGEAMQMLSERASVHLNAFAHSLGKKETQQ